jgi:hypothetical protein
MLASDPKQHTKSNAWKQLKNKQRKLGWGAAIWAGRDATAATAAAAAVCCYLTIYI